jgi:hypothetical protein
MDFTWQAGVQPWVGLGEHRPTHWGARPSQSEFFFSTQKGLITYINTLLWMQLMVEKWTFNYQATTLVDIPAVSKLHAPSTWDICGIVLCDKTAHFSGFLLSRAQGAPGRAVLSASWYATPVRWMDYLGKGQILTNKKLNKFVHILAK